MTGDPRCPDCAAPEPLVGLIEHACTCPTVTGKRRPRQQLPRERLAALARQCDAGWTRDNERRRAAKTRAAAG